MSHLAQSRKRPELVGRESARARPSVEDKIRGIREPGDSRNITRVSRRSRGGVRDFLVIKVDDYETGHFPRRGSNDRARDECVPYTHTHTYTHNAFRSGTGKVVSRPNDDQDYIGYVKLTR